MTFTVKEHLQMKLSDVEVMWLFPLLQLLSLFTCCDRRWCIQGHWEYVGYVHEDRRFLVNKDLTEIKLVFRNWFSQWCWQWQVQPFKGPGRPQSPETTPTSLILRTHFYCINFVLNFDIFFFASLCSAPRLSAILAPSQPKRWLTRKQLLK